MFYNKVYQFDTPMDELIMKEIDRAKRMDTMVVRTPYECRESIVVDDLTYSNFIDKCSDLKKIYLKLTYEKLKEIHTNYEIKRGGFYKLNKTHLYKYPDFMDAVSELLDAYESDPAVEEIFMMVFHEIYTQSPKQYYQKELRYGFVYTPKSQTIEVIDVADAVKKMDDIINTEQLEIMEDKYE